MRTVLFTHPSAELYGADRTLLDAVRATSEVGRDAIVALPRRGALAERLEEVGATVVVGELGAALRADLAPARFPAFLQKARTGARFVQTLVREHRVDLVHTNTSVLVGAAYGAHRAGVPHVWHVHEILDRPAWANRTMRTLIRRWSDIAVANSEATALAMFDERQTEQRVVYNGVDLARYTGPRRADLRQRLGLPVGKRLVVLPGRINSWKGQGLFLEAIAQRRAELAGAHFVIVGDAPPGQEHFVDALEETIAREGLRRDVTLLSFTEDLPDLLREADLCVVPSTRPEPFGMVVVEAMAAGTAVLAAGHGGPIEIVEPGRTGELFLPGSAEDLGAQLVELLSHRVDLAEMGANARDRVRRRFPLSSYERGIVDVHTDLIGPAPRRAAA